ncbi:thiamine diphosphokinase [Sphingobacterium corticibacterium]|uniref:Thiamine diphosphokinase n=1 Tax=Sphingobacterium corticibacterium TaxID=2484746 RepID=A0A4Q6XUI0_9SPHI|nr:thiamine diphosphokinase [Sphingobacterium corticibacterium]RZF60277.1 thiamine diphosphokinase [Sphingobacterium corticibacterium]
MSSHHIIRENQEPALIVASYEALDEEYMGQLLEWSPTVIANDDTVDFFLAADIKVDVIFGRKEITYPQEQIKNIPIKKGFIPDALDYLIHHNHKAVNIVCDAPDEALKAYSAAINMVVLSHGMRYVYIRHRYEKWKEAGARISVPENHLKSLVGLKHISPHGFITEQDGFMYLEFNSDEYVCIGEEI